MKVELRNVKYARFASEETDCFSATVYIDGKRAGEVSNAGHGGCDDYHPHTLGARLTEWAATLPPYIMSGEPRQHNAETAIGDLFTAWQYARDLKRALAKRLLFTKADKPGLFQSGTLPKAHIARIVAEQSVFEATKAKLNAAEILNCLPLDKALTIYRSNAA